jgi:hypothetical protein
VWISDYGDDETLHAFDKSATKLGVDQIDLLILHQALPGEFDRTLAAYGALETLLADGKVHAIGVSNFMTDHLDHLLAATSVVPAINQSRSTPTSNRAVWGQSLDRMRDRAAGATSTGEILQFVGDELRSRLVPARSSGLELVRHTDGLLATSWGAVSVGALTDGAGVSGNHLATQLKSMSVSPRSEWRASPLRATDPLRRRPDTGRLGGARARRGVLRSSTLQQRVQRLHRPHPDCVPDTSAPVSRREGIPPDNGPMPAELTFYKLEEPTI